MFNTRIKELKTKEEREQALQETILRVKSYSIEHQTMNLDPTDMRGLQHLMEEKRKLENLKNFNKDKIKQDRLRMRAAKEGRTHGRYYTEIS